jgi:hypothetical protein
MITRRTFLARTAGLALVTLAGRRLWAGESGPDTPITVYKSASCGCCAKWVDHLKANGFVPAVHDEDDMDAIKRELGVPAAIYSCHTALLDRYLIEGHVPAGDLQRLLKERPAIAGLAVPGMPGGTPGMHQPGTPAESYEVLSFARDGKTQLFARH